MVHSNETRAFVAKLFKDQPPDSVWSDNRGAREAAREAKEAATNDANIKDSGYGGAS